MCGIKKTTSLILLHRFVYSLSLSLSLSLLSVSLSCLSLSDEDECVSLPGVCGSARCENVEGSVMCECDRPGEEFDATTRQCVNTGRRGTRDPDYSLETLFCVCRCE